MEFDSFAMNNISGMEYDSTFSCGSWIEDDQWRDWGSECRECYECDYKECQNGEWIKIPIKE